MTRSEYAHEVGYALCMAYNRRNRRDIEDLIKSADTILFQNSLDRRSTEAFWDEVRKNFFDAGPAFERQANSSLHALMQLIESALANRQSGRS